MMFSSRLSPILPGARLMAWCRRCFRAPRTFPTVGLSTSRGSGSEDRARDRARRLSTISSGDGRAIIRVGRDHNSCYRRG